MQQISSAAGVRAMPTFQLYVGGHKKEEITGVDIVSLIVMLDKYKDLNPFQGKGRKLSSKCSDFSTCLASKADLSS